MTKTQARTITIELGLLCDPLTKQLAGLVPKECMEDLDRMNKGLNYIILRNLISAAEGDRARKRLMKIIQRDLKASAGWRKKAAAAGGAQ